MADFQNQAPAIRPEQIIEIIIRRRWVIVLPLCVLLTFGFFYTLRAPQTFEASTTILIQPQKVPTDFIQPIITMDIAQRINTISQQILSRTNLEKIIEEFDLYQDKKDMFQEDKINDLRRRVVVTQNSGRSQGTEAFSVSFTGGNPKTVMNVANKLATFFIDENLRTRETQAVGTSEFLESELEKIKKTLEQREQALAAYRAKYLGGLPDELETNLRTLDRLQTQYSDAVNALRERQNTAALLKTQISRMKEMEQAGVAPSTGPGQPAVRTPVSEAQSNYDDAKSTLEALETKYTDKHPEVIKQRKFVAKLKEKLDEEKKKPATETPQTEDGQSETSPPATASTASSALFQEELNLRQLNNEIKELKKSIKQIKAAMAVYQKRVEDTPKREQELQAIQRDYNNIRQTYNSLLARRLEAELAVNMERKQKGEQFRIIDYARLPQKPISPDIRKLFMLFFAAGLGVAGGIIGLLEFLKPAIRTEAQIEKDLGLEILAAIPPLPKPGAQTKKRVELGLFGVTVLYTAGILSLFGLLYLKGIDKTLSLVKSFI